MMGEISSIFAKRSEANKNNSDLQTRRINRSGSKASSVDRILYLQRTIGNQAVSRLIRSKALQAKLRIGQPGDVYEQEADRVADEVMRMPEPGVQRQVEPEEEEEEILQAKPLVDQITPLVQRQVEEEEEEMLQPKSREDITSEVSNDLDSQINAIKGGGRPLAESERAYFEPRFGADFSRVRVHTDTRATDSAQAVNARAYTVGQDVVFGTGQYVPETTSGQRLLAHELTHVIQQGESILNRTTQEREGDGNIRYQLNAIGRRSSVPCIQTYRRDVHYDATKRWSESFFGRGSSDADTIAREDQGMDDRWTTAPAVTSIAAFLTGSISNNDLVHFPSRATAESEVRAAIGSANLVDFGRALHRFQDSFSHSFPPPPGTGYNLDSKARPDNVFERVLASTLRRIGAQGRYPNTRYGKGAVIRHVILGHYPDDFKAGASHINPEQGTRNDVMERRSIDFIRDFYTSWTALRSLRVPVPPGLRVPSLIFGPSHVGPYIRRP
ncbi:MAG: DUF4157 domain-containing protein [ANME-2 cluster archaeon]|nr:DUF4157 domain-containing protein [ANME-2 cluster archaeon]MBC2708379.1 DUF4157 domain-containing protein [ANME-2 cluster archaeon]MBC2747535.1 DUF4157 domain-containing protein [ANME-2 cluster archaeon]